MKKCMAMLWFPLLAGFLLAGCATTTMTPESAQWRLTELSGMPAAATSAASLEFDRGPPLRAFGSTGCNRFAASYMLLGTRLTFGSPATTRMACPGVMEQERAFEQALEAARNWRIIDRHLELFDADGALLARFAAADER
ncbi:MAG: META domain-containing protein [Gammaproteobacteria bacterium]